MALFRYRSGRWQSQLFAAWLRQTNQSLIQVEFSGQCPAATPIKPLEHWRKSFKLVPYRGKSGH